MLFMRTKKIIISLSLFILFVGSTLLVNSITNTGTTDQPSLNTSKISSLADTANVTAFYSSNPNIVIGNANLAPIWAQDPNKLDVAPFSDGAIQGYMKAIHDDRYMYCLFAFASAIPWIGVEWNATTTPMENGHNGWIFGNTTSEGYYGDVQFLGEVAPVSLPPGALSYETIVGSNGLTYIEAVRALNTNDPNNVEVVFNIGATMNLRFASGLNAQTHKGENPASIYPFTISSTAIPVQSGTQPTTTTSPTPIAVVKAQHLQDILIWGSSGFFFIVILLNVLVIFYRRF